MENVCEPSRLGVKSPSDSGNGQGYAGCGETPGSGDKGRPYWARTDGSRPPRLARSPIGGPRREMRRGPSSRPPEPRQRGRTHVRGLVQLLLGGGQVRDSRQGRARLPQTQENRATRRCTDCTPRCEGVAVSSAQSTAAPSRLALGPIRRGRGFPRVWTRMVGAGGVTREGISLPAMVSLRWKVPVTADLPTHMLNWGTETETVGAFSPQSGGAPGLCRPPWGSSGLLGLDPSQRNQTGGPYPHVQ